MRRTRVNVLAAWLLLVTVTATSCSVVDPVRVDAAQMERVQARLAPVIADFDRVPMPQAAEPAGAAELFGCQESSGGVSQPSVHRVWELEDSAKRSDLFETSPEGRTAGEQVAQSLAASGWSTRPDPGLEGQTIIRKPVGDGDARGAVLVTSDSVILSAGTDLEPCSLR
ncbi:MAG TPA: hypothetical protein VM433_13760 [Mycobacteriales bacterium]|nr:hypothetical protein [Mycobacteriales bacterium]